MSVIIPRGTVIPTKKTKQYHTTKDMQTSIKVEVFEGERPLTKDNHRLGKFSMTGIPPAPKGVGKIEVTFELDENSILLVTATDVANKSNQKNISITNDKGRLS